MTWWKEMLGVKDTVASAEQAAAEAAVRVRPPILNPAAHEHLAFAEWRAAHIQRWLDDPDNARAPLEKRNFLEAERDMHLAVLRQHGHDV